jgi:Skp family chaperone for outer membrane proteins
MNRMLVCSEDGLFSLRIGRILTAGNYAYDIVKTPIRRDDLINYHLMIIHASYRLSGLTQFIEHLVLAKVIPVIYISSTIEIGGFQLLMKHPHFVFVDENKLDSELPVTIRLVAKYVKELKETRQEVQKVESNLESERLMAKCKKQLMDSGLSEEESHRKILKTAMDAHLDKRSACQRILDEKKQ